MTPWMRGALLAAPALALGALPALAADEPKLDAGNTAWMIVATCLVLMMTIPGVALFYAGMVRKKTVLATMMQSFFVAALIAVTWMVAGYSIAFGNGGLYFGDFSKVMFAGIEWNGPFILGKGLGGESEVATTIPETVFAMFQMTFAIITAALIFGAVADRMKFSAVCLFIVPWSLLIYSPVAHAVWHPSGLIWAWGALDFAGGTVVHINAGVAGLVAALVLGKRVGYGHDNMSPHNLAFAMIGASLLWVGWFGFNAGSALEANGSAALAMINTFVATAAGGLFWMLTERAMGHKGSALGFCSGVIAGLVAVTPAAGNSGPFGAILLGAIASIVCYFFVAKVKPALGYDDALDAFGIHGVGGIVGAIGTAIVFSPALGGPGGEDYDMVSQLGVQAFASAFTIALAAVGTAIAIVIAKAVTGLRVDEESEVNGLDISEHGERAYN